ncbi:MAG: hypothetical protein N3E40_01110, partial [Dehalococcoidia bacterium]|nr:hypothetical protein [Dehalococcoidia bacterium]
MNLLLKMMGRRHRSNPDPAALLFLIVVLLVFVLPQNAEPGVLLPVVTYGCDDGSSERIPQRLFPKDTLVLVVADVPRPAVDESREPRRSWRAMAECQTISFETTCA